MSRQQTPSEDAGAQSVRPVASSITTPISGRDSRQMRSSLREGSHRQASMTSVGTSNPLIDPVVQTVDGNGGNPISRSPTIYAAPNGSTSIDGNAFGSTQDNLLLHIGAMHQPSRSSVNYSPTLFIGDLGPRHSTAVIDRSEVRPNSNTFPPFQPIQRPWGRQHIDVPYDNSHTEKDGHGAAHNMREGPWHNIGMVQLPRHHGHMTRRAEVNHERRPSHS